MECDHDVCDECAARRRENEANRLRGKRMLFRGMGHLYGALEQGNHCILGVGASWSGPAIRSHVPPCVAWVGYSPEVA